MNKAVASALALFALASTSAFAAPSPARQHVEGDLQTGCKTLGVVKLCGDQEQALVVAGKPTDLMFALGNETRSFEIEKRGNFYRVKLGIPGVADTDFFHFEEVSFERVGPRYLVTKFTYASSHECDGRPDLRRLDTLDFKGQTLTTELEPAWTASGKPWKYIDKKSLPTLDIYKLSSSVVTDLMAETPANEKLCEIYG